MRCSKNGGVGTPVVELKRGQLENVRPGCSLNTHPEVLLRGWARTHDTQQASLCQATSPRPASGAPDPPASPVLRPPCHPSKESRAVKRKASQGLGRPQPSTTAW